MLRPAKGLLVKATTAQSTETAQPVVIAKATTAQSTAGCRVLAAHAVQARLQQEVGLLGSAGLDIEHREFARCRDSVCAAEAASLNHVDLPVMSG